MNPTLNIPVILGASRPERQSEKVANYILKVLQSIPEVTTQLVDVKNFRIEYDDDENREDFHPIVVAADAFVLVFPEYNHGFPGKLKSLIDTELEDYKHKPVALASVSSGQFGGARATELLTPVLTHVGMLVTDLNMYFPHVKEAFDELGDPIDPKIQERVTRTISELLYLTKVIKSGKNQVPDLNV